MFYLIFSFSWAKRKKVKKKEKWEKNWPFPTGIQTPAGFYCNFWKNHGWNFLLCFNEYKLWKQQDFKKQEAFLYFFRETFNDFFVSK